MEALTVQSFDNEWVISIDKKLLPPGFMEKFLKRLQAEMQAQKVEIAKPLKKLKAGSMKGFFQLHRS